MAVRFSVIIFTHDHPEALKNLLEGLFQQTLQEAFEVLVVEDCHADAISSAEAAVKAFQKENLHYYRLPEAGPGLCQNKGAEKAEGQYLIFLEDCCVVPANWLQCVATAIEKKPDADILYGPINSTAPAVYPFLHSCRMEEDPIRTLNICLKREAFEALGGYDPNLSYWAYEWDLIERAQASRYALTFVGEMAIDYPPVYRSPEYFNFSKIMRVIERSGYLMKKHPNSEKIMENFLLVKFQGLHFWVRLWPLLLLFFFSPWKVCLIFVLFNIAYDALRLIRLQCLLMQYQFSVKESDAFRYLLWNWSLDFGLFFRQLLLIPYRF